MKPTAVDARLKRLTSTERPTPSRSRHHDSPQAGTSSFTRRLRSRVSSGPFSRANIRRTYTYVALLGLCLPSFIRSLPLSPKASSLILYVSPTLKLPLRAVVPPSYLHREDDLQGLKLTTWSCRRLTCAPQQSSAGAVAGASLSSTTKDGLDPRICQRTERYGSARMCILGIVPRG